jgi:thioredoxin 1
MPNDSLISHASDATFEETVLSSDIPVLVDFWAPWCGPCHMLTPTFEKLALEYEGRVRFVKVNVDEAQQIASSLGIMGIPTISLFDHGKSIDRQVGVQPKAILSEMIERALLATTGSSQTEEHKK